ACSDEIKCSLDDRQTMFDSLDTIDAYVDCVEEVRDIIRWVKTDMAYKAPEQLVERVGLWQAKLESAQAALDKHQI
ncbi:hypothetical protein LCGC14_2641960, partial [marine sediment metagenome]